VAFDAAEEVFDAVGVAIAAGHRYALARKDEGTLVGWGAVALDLARVGARVFWPVVRLMRLIRA